MPLCCQCNGSGCCISCFCVKSGSWCVNCLPLCNGRCLNYESTIGDGPDGDYSGRLLPLSMPQSTTLDAIPEAITESIFNGKPDLQVGAMFKDVSAVPLNPGSSFESGADQVCNYSLPSFRPMVGTDYKWRDLSGQVFSSSVDDAYN